MTDTAGDRILLLAVGLVTFFLMGGLQAVYGPALPMLARETGQSVAQVSGLFTVHWLGSAGGVALTFVLGTRITPRVVVLLLAAGAALLGAGAGWPVTLAGAALSGMGQGGAAVVFNPRLLASFGARGPAMLSLTNAVFGGGAILAPMALVVLGGAYGLIFLSLAVGFALLVAVARDAGQPAMAAAAPAFRPDLAILAFGACGIGLEAALIGLGPAALVRAGASEVQGAEAMSAFFIAFLLARIGLTFAAHRIAPFALYALSVGGVALCMAAAVVLPPYWMFVLAGGFAGMIFPGYFVEAARRMGQHPRVSPLIVAGGLVGGISLPFLLARLTEGMGQRGFFQVMAGLAIAVTVAALLALVLRRAPLPGARGQGA
ncbi:MFS transporter [Gemmobacter caeruleus]|uniref:MFS transporter n=1 Tax=Gemmobacter caeruleus TaxID=2595004 RepID=UPI0011EF4052|nr:MFS transporter [Gemmobacter caeruleus]